MLPRIYAVNGSQGLAIPAALGAGSPSSTAALVFTFPQACFVAGLLAFGRPDAGMPDMRVQSAKLSLAIIDETTHPIVSDSRGTLVGSGQFPQAVPLLVLSGRSFRPFALQRPVSAGDRWSFTVQNVDTFNATTLAGIFLYVERATR